MVETASIFRKHYAERQFPYQKTQEGFNVLLRGLVSFSTTLNYDAYHSVQYIAGIGQLHVEEIGKGGSNPMSVNEVEIDQSV